MSTSRLPAKETQEARKTRRQALLANTTSLLEDIDAVFEGLESYAEVDIESLPKNRLV